MTSESAAVVLPALAACPLLRSVRVSRNDLGSDGVAALAEFVRARAATLVDLRASSCLMGSEGPATLAGALATCAKLEVLHVGRNGVGGNGAVALVESLQMCRGNFRELGLDWSSIDESGATSLVGALQELPNLQSIDLTHNIIGARGAAAVGVALKCWPSLVRLDLSFCDIGDELSSAGPRWCGST